jgi:uncharacterized RDD family membrane protein YckC
VIETPAPPPPPDPAEPPERPELPDRPELPAGPVPNYAGFVSRLLAFSIDALLAVALSTVGFAATSAVLSVLDSDSGHPAAAVGFLLAVPAVFVLYCAGFWALWGRTPGMLLLGLRVVPVTGGDLGLGRSLLRVLAYWVSAILFLGFIWIAVDRRSQGFHDKIARTFCVYDWEREVD